ncbi:MAG: DoxX family protein [Ferruginibacter sp.]
MKKINLLIMTFFYLAAGINHFYNPGAYYKIIPPFFSNAELVNVCGGIAEIVLGILLIFSQTRKIAAYGIILMLIAFIPTHIYMLQVGFCVNNFCLPQWVLWLRLILLQPLLILWAWTNRK